jgi:GGDEF domain-containing protein
MGPRPGDRCCTPQSPPDVTDGSIPAVIVSMKGYALAEAAMSIIDLAQVGIERAHYNNLFDPVTGLPTGWVLLIDRLEMALARCRRTGNFVALFVLDKPRLSSDAAFPAVVQALRLQLRGDDTLARIGDDRLAIMCTDVADDSAAAFLARRLINDAGVTCSLGVALGGPGDSSDQLLARGIAAATEEFHDDLG